MIMQLRFRKEPDCIGFPTFCWSVLQMVLLQHKQRHHLVRYYFFALSDNGAALLSWNWHSSAQH